ncbi:MAG: radical SAM protein [Candidatus Omnitrophica bacterium]|nr:radical SAM protein [Candidatus Omnitrophota bacterium]
MVRLKERIKSALSAEILYFVVMQLGRISNEQLIKLSYLAEKILTREDPIIEKSLRQLRQYFKANHPSVELVRRILRELNPRCKKALIKTFFIKAIFQGICQGKEYQEKEGITPPWFLVLSPTMRCNLNCVGCSTRRYTAKDDLPVSIIKRILNEAKQMGIHFITTQGGEMFVYEEMLDVYKKHPDIYFQVYTNGTLIDKKISRILAKLGNVAPMLSLEGFEDSTDQRRGKGVFKKVMQAMDNLREVGCFFGASVTQTRKNTDEIIQDAFFEMLLKKGCFVIWFFQFLPIGKDPDLNLMATPKQRILLREKITQVRERLPIFIGDFWNDGPFVGGCIAAGRRYLHINNKGDVEPCAFVHFAVDNIKNKSLKEVLNSEFFKILRKAQPYGNGNLLTPCMIIDNPEVLREAVRKTRAYPTHEGAEVILDGQVKNGLDAYAKEIHQLTAVLWDRIKDKAVKWPS